jgi:hypothetical protein
MLRYFYAWTPLIVVAAVVLLAIPWLGLIALVIATLATLAALVALAWAIVEAPLAIGHAIGRRWHGRGVAPQPSPSPALMVAERRRT